MKRFLRCFCVGVKKDLRRDHHEGAKTSAMTITKWRNKKSDRGAMVKVSS